MPLFEYTGLNEAGKSVKGMREADSQKTLRALLRKDGIFLTQVATSAGAAAGGKVEEETGAKRWFTPRVKTDDIAIMTRQLATLIGAGIPLVEALGALVEQVEHPRLRKVISQVKQRVNEGSSLADALNKVMSDSLVEKLTEGARAFGQKIAPSRQEWDQRMIAIYTGENAFLAA